MLNGARSGWASCSALLDGRRGAELGLASVTIEVERVGLPEALWGLPFLFHRSIAELAWCGPCGSELDTGGTIAKARERVYERVQR